MIIIKVESAAITHVGLVRNNNEDNYYINGKYKSDNSVTTEGSFDNKNRDSYLYAVCDGMGGEAHGELASLIAVSTLSKYQETDIQYTITDYIQEANDHICDEIEKNAGKRCGTTLALLYIRKNMAISYNIGDSRVLFFRDGDLYQLSEDHTEAQRLVNMGVLTEEEADSHKSRNKLTQHLGIFPEELAIKPYISEKVKLKKNDILLLCSDGLTDMVSADDIANILSIRDIDIISLVKRLTEAAETHGGKDNITVVVVKIT